MEVNRSLTKNAINGAPLLTKVRDKYGDVWVKVEEDSWLSSLLEVVPNKHLHSRRVVTIA